MMRRKFRYFCCNPLFWLVDELNESSIFFPSYAPYESNSSNIFNCTVKWNCSIIVDLPCGTIHNFRFSAFFPLGIHAPPQIPSKVSDSWWNSLPEISCSWKSLNAMHICVVMLFFVCWRVMRVHLDHPCLSTSLCTIYKNSMGDRMPTINTTE